MSDQLPKDFDPAWYAARYADVGLSGLSPQDHYRRFGRQMGRRPNGKGEVRRPIKQPLEALSDVGFLPPSEERADGSDPQRSSPIIDRPADFSPAKLRDLPTPTMDEHDARIALSELARRCPHDSACDAISAYARLLRLDMSAIPNSADRLPSCRAAAFQSGLSRIENAWFADRTRLRLMMAGATDADPDVERLILRAYQSDMANLGELVPIEPSLQLPEFGPIFHDLQPIQPLMPILLELSSESGVRAIALIPFPSLLPGGLHWAELKALQTETNPIDDFWSMSDTLLREAIGVTGSPERSITSITRTSAGELSLRPELDEWLLALFGVRARNDHQPVVGDAVPPGLDLSLPGEFVPTISAMVSRQVSLSDFQALAGPYLIADLETYRPRWSIVLPTSDEPWCNVPVVRPRGSGRDQPSEVKPAHFHLGIALHPPASITVAALGAELLGETTTATLSEPITAVIKISDPSRTIALVQSLRRAAGAMPLELIFRLPEDTSIRSTLDSLCGSADWTAVSIDADFRDVARNVRSGMVLSVDDRIRLDDPGVLGMLQAMLRNDSAAASISCALLSEAIIKSQTVIQPASGGLFPAGVSFGTSPRLSFNEPDVLQALPDQTYPVVANTMLLALFRKEALARLPQLAGPVPVAAADIRLGLDLMHAGYRNWCTTKGSATLANSYVRRDAIDPVGGAYVDPTRWEQILTRVTLVRELF